MKRIDYQRTNHEINTSASKDYLGKSSADNLKVNQLDDINTDDNSKSITHSLIHLEKMMDNNFSLLNDRIDRLQVAIEIYFCCSDKGSDGLNSTHKSIGPVRENLDSVTQSESNKSPI